ncbi:hypothetical protein [Amycolatopsis sp. 195334CR]|uniref:hypothetical protein n=1 Tax=Amycolatopsis sp. 195334CR TaxID=2814588 RepID=UPI001A8E82B1|nr:hypothetical protein [Amycolatopsis sp. 195334CR]MBN6040047.1 hypothetical protein [Amycolatopsis sp. 195334CR]
MSLLRDVTPGSEPVPPSAVLVGPGIPAEEAGSEQCETCGRALPRAESKAGQPLRFCYERHTRWRVPDTKGGTKLMKCRDVAAAWQVEGATRGRADAPGPPIDLLGLGEQVTAFGTTAAELLAPAQALAELATRIQSALAGDVAAGRRAVERMQAAVRDMRGQVTAAEAKTAAAERAAEEARTKETAAVAAAAEAERTATEATRERDEARGELLAEQKRRAGAEELRAAALSAKDLAESENASLAATVTQLQTRVEEVETAAGEAAREHREEIGRLHQQRTEALATAQAHHDQQLADRGRQLAQQLQQERERLAGDLERVTIAHAAERDRLTTEHAAERDRLTAELATVRAEAATTATTHTAAIAQLNRELGAAGAASQTAITALTGLRTRLAALLDDPPDDLTARIARLLDT